MIQSHNLILDLVLWNGLAVGLGIASALAWWCWTVVRRVNTLKHWTMMSFVMVLGTHAMLEYPLQYAYFLLPAGLIMGCLHSALGFGVGITPARWLNGGLLVLGVAMLGITIRDYLRVETSFYGLRFEHKKVETSIPRTPPEVIGLTQLRDYIALARMEPAPGMTPEELQWVKGVVTTVPSAFVLYRFAAMLAMNDKPADAGLWLKRLCQTAPRVQCDAIRDEWGKAISCATEVCGHPLASNAKLIRTRQVSPQGSRRKRHSAESAGFHTPGPALAQPIRYRTVPRDRPLAVSLCCAATCLVLLAGASNTRLAKVAALAWLGAALLSAGIGLLQYFGVSSLLAPWVNVTGAGEAFANLRQRNQFATLTNMGLAALVWVSAHRPSRTTVFAASLAAAAVLAIGNAASSSRTGLIQLVLLLALFALWGGLRQARVRAVMLVAGLAYAAGSVVLPLLAGLDLSSTGISGPPT